MVEKEQIVCTPHNISLISVNYSIVAVSRGSKPPVTLKRTRSDGDIQAINILTDNAKNLMRVVTDVLHATETATIRVTPEIREKLSGLSWVKTSEARQATLN